MTEPLTRERIETLLSNRVDEREAHPEWRGNYLNRDVSITVLTQLLATLDTLEAERTAHAELVARCERMEGVVAAVRWHTEVAPLVDEEGRCWDCRRLVKYGHESKCLLGALAALDAEATS